MGYVHPVGPVILTPGYGNRTPIEHGGLTSYASQTYANKASRSLQNSNPPPPPLILSIRWEGGTGA